MNVDTFLHRRLFCRPGMLIPTTLLWLLLAESVMAQKVWILDIATDPAEASFNVDVLKTLSVGESFELRVDRDVIYSVRIDETRMAENGDRTWFGSIENVGLDYSLVITVGKQTGHVVLTSPSGIYQLYGIRTGEYRYTGPFNLLEYVRDDLISTDTVVPTDSPQGNDVLINDGDIAISQSVSQRVAPVGADLVFNLEFSLVGNEAQFGEYVDIYFVLENTDLVETPETCDILQSTDNQPVLSCSLGDFSSGSVKNLSFTVATSDISYPLVYSTAIVGDVRSDVIVELYRDVVTDTDSDGISNFNEGLLGTDSLDGMEVNNRDAEIDILVAYTPEIDSYYRGEVNTRINQLFNVANKIFSSSQAGIVVRPVGVHEVSYTPADNLVDDLSNVTFQNDESLQDLGRKRMLFGGDLLVLFRKAGNEGLCGLANLSGSGTQGDLSAVYQKDFGVSVINIDCEDDSVLAHEIGHNLGLVHSRREDAAGGTFSYSSGYGVDTRFVTLMAYPDDFDVVNRLYRFSDPTRACGPFACGADKDDEVEGSYAVASLNLVKYQVENYYSSQQERLLTAAGVSSVDGVIDADIGLGIYSDSSVDFGAAFSNSETLNFRLAITPLQSQVGREYTTHLVIISNRSQLFQATSKGNFVTWNGSLKTLEPVTDTRVMDEYEMLDILTGVDLEQQGFGDASLNIYVAYRMLDTKELVYSRTPFSLSVSAEQSD